MVFVEGGCVIFILHGFCQLFVDIIALEGFLAPFIDEIIMAVSLNRSCSAGSQEEPKGGGQKEEPLNGLNALKCCQNARCARGAIYWCVCKSKRHDFSFKFKMKPVSYHFFCVSVFYELYINNTFSKVSHYFL